MRSEPARLGGILTVSVRMESFELFCTESNFSRYFAKCCNLFKYFVAHMTVIARNDEIILNLTTGQIKFESN